MAINWERIEELKKGFTKYGKDSEYKEWQKNLAEYLHLIDEVYEEAKKAVGNLQRKKEI